MPIKSTGIGQAWFYHAPAKAKSKEEGPVGAPPISQIAGLCGQDQQESATEPNRYWIRETDSEYNRLAKQGGRPDLLNMRPRETAAPSEAVGYAHCDWFYDNPSASNQQTEAESSKEPYEFKVPAYMTHPDPKPRQSNDGYVGRGGDPQSQGITVHVSTESDNKGNQTTKVTKKKVSRKPVKVNTLIKPPEPCKPPEDHIGPNAVHIVPKK